MADMADLAADRATPLRAGFDAYARGDFDTVVATFHPDIEIQPLGGQPPIWGRKAVRHWLEPDAFTRQEAELLEVRAAGNKALTRHRARAFGATSRIEIEFEVWSVWTYDDAGLVTRWEMYSPNEREKAFATAGVSALDAGG